MPMISKEAGKQQALLKLREAKDLTENLFEKGIQGQRF
ncbi:hypothetical protein JZO67_003890 [Enterococcus sp. 665A]|uniref:Uncharacterized protein n=1 Tax=Candidatus Enterococcus ferrettii TaxID=2815324 RepID=A0ABV0ETE9_9ENTE